MTRQSEVAANAELMARIAELEAANAALKAAKIRPITFKVGTKGGISVYGLQNPYPVTLYANQWERLIQHIPQLQAFIASHQSELSVKE